MGLWNAFNAQHIDYIYVNNAKDLSEVEKCFGRLQKLFDIFSGSTQS
jgi:hypothetical protein